MGAEISNLIGVINRNSLTYFAFQFWRSVLIDLRIFFTDFFCRINLQSINNVKEKIRKENYVFLSNLKKQNKNLISIDKLLNNVKKLNEIYVGENYNNREFFSDKINEVYSKINDFLNDYDNFLIQFENSFKLPDEFNKLSSSILVPNKKFYSILLAILIMSYIVESVRRVRNSEGFFGKAGEIKIGDFVISNVITWTDTFAIGFFFFIYLAFKSFVFFENIEKKANEIKEQTEKKYFTFSEEYFTQITNCFRIRINIQELYSFTQILKTDDKEKIGMMYNFYKETIFDDMLNDLEFLRNSHQKLIDILVNINS
ncbi:unnamed protein product [Brachionus calyciflorus]|uniref:Uncharacterized protein n=1 Tax=Brachionus calyciflorus TaxID=104777 RepID=A0A814JDJ8_9BILA|nr:unnamed protein product [Brachionus calyciflorus]